MSRKTITLANNNGNAIEHEHVRCGAIVVDDSSDCVFHFLHASTEGSGTVEAKHKFETFSNNVVPKTKHYHGDNRIFNNKLFKESCMST